MISGKIANAGKYDLIIRFGWWNNDQPLKNIGNPTKFVFDKATCHAYVGDAAVADLFEWDETVPYDEEGQYVGRIKREEEGGVQLETLPKQY